MRRATGAVGDFVPRELRSPSEAPTSSLIIARAGCIVLDLRLGTVSVIFSPELGSRARRERDLIHAYGQAYKHTERRVSRVEMGTTAWSLAG